ncbi:trypsin-like peptidase domain-containing protein [Micromonospora maris]|uniref:trypsin-like peptidase domain-containing protein n=1 Tax=Micromonospora maris TaxID=1003110 RepID=UPI0009DA5426
MAEAHPAIGGICLDVENPSADDLVGSAFAVSSTTALTAFHCVGDREIGAVRHERVSIWFRGRFVGACVVDSMPDIDVAVLELEKGLPEDLEPLQLISEVSVQAKFTSIGWPRSRDFGEHWRAISGHIVDTNSKIFNNAPALQLYCVEAATLSLHGYSGAPVLVGDGRQAAAGVIRWNPQRPDAPDLAAGGTVYATPISAILMRSNHLQSLSESQLTIAAGGEPRDGYCISHSNVDLEIARWVGGVLRGERIGARVRGEYILPGMNYVPLLRAAHEKYPDTLLVLSSSTLKCDSPSHMMEMDWMKGGEIPGIVLPVRVGSAKMPNFLYDIEPIDLRGYKTEDEVREALIAGLVATERPRLPAPRFPAERLISQKPTTLSRSRLAQVTLADRQRIEGGV